MLDHCLETLTLLAEHLREQGAGKVEAMLECLRAPDEGDGDVIPLVEVDEPVDDLRGQS